MTKVRKIFSIEGISVRNTFKHLCFFVSICKSMLEVNANKCASHYLLLLWYP